MLLKFLIFAIATNCDCLQLRYGKWDWSYKLQLFVITIERRIILQIATACNYDNANEIEAANEEQRLKRAKIKKSNASEISDICNCDKLWLLAITIQQMRLKLQMKSKD